MGDEVFAHDVAECVFQLHVLDEEVVFGVDAGCGVRIFEVEAEPFLNSQALQAWSSGREIHEEDQIERQRGGEDGVAAEEVNLELHGVAKPAEDVDIIPTFFVITAWRVIVDANFVVEILVEVGVELGLEDVFEYAELGDFLGLEGFGVVEDLAVAVAEDVGGVPAGDADVADLEGWARGRS